MWFENRHNQRYRMERTNGWIAQIAGLFTGMASTCLVGSMVIPLLTGVWPSNPALWLIAGILLFVAALLVVNHISIEEDEWTTGD